jgi:hypothetical protein
VGVWRKKQPSLFSRLGMYTWVELSLACHNGSRTFLCRAHFFCHSLIGLLNVEREEDEEEEQEQEKRIR